MTEGHLLQYDNSLHLLRGIYSTEIIQNSPQGASEEYVGGQVYFRYAIEQESNENCLRL